MWNDFPNSFFDSALAAKTNSPAVLINAFDITRIKELLKNKNVSILKVLEGESVVNGVIVDEISGSIGNSSSETPVAN